MQEASSGCREQRATRHTGQQPKAAGAGAGGSGRQAPTSELGPGLPPPHGFPGFTSQQVSHFAPDPWGSPAQGPRPQAGHEHGATGTSSGGSLSPAPRAPSEQEARPWPPPDSRSLSRCQVHGGRTVKAEPTSESGQAWRCPGRMAQAGASCHRDTRSLPWPAHLAWTSPSQQAHSSAMLLDPGGATGCPPSRGRDTGQSPL